MEELRLRHTGVAHQQNVDITAVSRAVFIDLCLATEELEHEGFLDAFHAKDGRRNAACQKVVDIGMPSNVLDFVFFLLGDDDLLQRDVLPLQRMNPKEDVEHRRVFAAFSLGTDEQHTVGFDTITGVEAPRKVLFPDAQDAFGLNAALHLLGKFLEFNELRVDEMGGLLLEQKPGLAFVSAAAAIDLRAFQRLDEFLFVWLVDLHGVTACHAFEHSRIQARAHPGDLGRDGIDGDHASNVIGAELRHRSHLVAGKVDDAHERHQVAFASVQQELAQRLIGRKEMMLGVGQNVLCKFVVVTLHLTERDLEGALVGPHFCEVVDGFGVLVLEEGRPAGGEVEFLNRRHRLHLRALAIEANGI